MEKTLSFILDNQKLVRSLNLKTLYTFYKMIRTQNYNL